MDMEKRVGINIVNEASNDTVKLFYMHSCIQFHPFLSFEYVIVHNNCIAPFITLDTFVLKTPIVFITVFSSALKIVLYSQIL